MFADVATKDFFRARLHHMIDLRHSLAVLASRMPWQQIEASVAHLFSRRARTGEVLPDLDACSAKKAWRSCSHRSSTWPSRSS